MAHIASVASAHPEHKITTTEARELVRSMFSESVADIDRLMPLFGNTHIETRSIACPPEWYTRTHDLTESNQAFLDIAPGLCVEASVKALAEAGLDPGHVSAIVLATSTGLSTPSLDAQLVPLLGLPRHVRRVPIWGLGCAAGLSGLAVADSLASSLQSPVLFISIELCSLTFQRNDFSKSNLVGTSIFADGVAAVVLDPEKGSKRIAATYSHQFDDSADVMGWEITSAGLKVRFSKDIPMLIRESIVRLGAEACQRGRRTLGDINHFVFHPGGAKVIEAYKDAFGLSEEQLAHTRGVLRDFGNMSGPTVLYVLERYLKKPESFVGPALMASLGPGFTAEFVVLEDA